MNYNIASIPLFDKQAKRLVKKYPTLRNELEALVQVLLRDPEHGTHLGNQFYKIRLAIKSKAKGKSGGARVITYLKISAATIYFASIYDKSERSNISLKELKTIFGVIPN